MCGCDLGPGDTRGNGIRANSQEVCSLIGEAAKAIRTRTCGLGEELKMKVGPRPHGKTIEEPSAQSCEVPSPNRSEG